MGMKRRVFVLELLFGFILSIGVGVLVGAVSATAGIGAGLITCALIGLAFVLAWERANAE